MLILESARTERVDLRKKKKRWNGNEQILLCRSEGVSDRVVTFQAGHRLVCFKSVFGFSGWSGAPHADLR